MLQYPPIIIINGVDNDNTLQEYCIMPETCPSHSRHEEKLDTHDREFKIVREEMKGFADVIKEKVNTKVFWIVIPLILGAVGATFTKQEQVLDKLSEVSTSQQLMQKDIENMKEDIKELKDM